MKEVDKAYVRICFVCVCVCVCVSARAPVACARAHTRSVCMRVCNREQTQRNIRKLIFFPFVFFFSTFILTPD